MYDPEKFLKETMAAFERAGGHDAFIFIQDLKRTLRPYQDLDPFRQLGMRTQITAHLTKAFEGKPHWKDSPSFTAEEKTGLYLRALHETHADLFACARQAVEKASAPLLKTDERPPARIPALAELMVYTVQPNHKHLDDEVSKMVSLYLGHPLSNFPALSEQLQNTPYANAIKPDHVRNYVIRVDAKKHSYDILDLRRLRDVPSVWKDFESRAAQLPVFAAYAPHLDFTRGTGVGAAYDAAYSPQTNFLGLRFNDAARGIQHSPNWTATVADDHLRNLHIMLNHARHVIQGNAAGGVTQNKDWIKYQNDKLVPLLNKDIAGLEDKMASAKIQIPGLPAPILPRWREHEFQPIGRS